MSTSSQERLVVEQDLERLPKTRPTAAERETDPVTPPEQTPDGEPATQQEIEDLFHVVDDIPLGVWLASLTAACERFVWFGATSPFQNYMQHNRNSAIPGAFGLKQDTATIVMNAFFAVAYFTPIPGAIVADAWLGRYHTILISALLVLAGSTVLFVTSLPSILTQQGNASIAGLGVCMLLMAFGSGGVRAAGTPFIADQYTETTPRIKTRKNGERVVTDRELTIQYIYNAYFWIVNIAGLSALGTTFLEKYVGFWAAYLPPLVVMALSFIPLILYKNRFVRSPPSGTVLLYASRALGLAAKGGFRLEAAKPTVQLAQRQKLVPWSERFVEELGLALFACRILLFFPPHWLALNQTFNNLIAQAGQMVSYGIPNDAIKSTNPIAAIILYPLIQRVLYPALRRARIRFGSAARITTGFALLTASMVYAAVLQHFIYLQPPCYSHPLACDASKGGTVPNQISIFLQIPVYALGAATETFCLTTATEHAYNQAPRSMRSIIYGVSQAMAGIGACLAMALNPLSKDPKQVALYSLVAGIMAATTTLFWLCFRHIDKQKLEVL